MKIIKASYEFITPVNRDAVLKRLEQCGRVCYKSEERITGESAARFVKNLVANKHFSVLEHVSMTVRIICDRAVSHELVRHRLASYSQESQRYVDYGSEEGLVFIEPCMFAEDVGLMYHWKRAMLDAEDCYQALRKAGASPQAARSVLPNSVKTEIIMTCNLREWLHVFKLRCSKGAYPPMREIMVPLRREFAAFLPEVFGGSSWK